MAAGIPNLQDYLNAFVPGGGGPASDVGTAASVAGLAAAPATGGLSALLSLLGGGVSLGSLLGGLLGGGRSATGPGSATSDIASGAGAYSDPVISLLGEGATALGGNTPVSSPSAGPTYGPYFDAARKWEDLLRWGPGGLTDPKAEALDATTLKNAMTELGNPGTGTGTLQALQQAFQSGSKYLTPDNLKLLLSQMNPTEQQISKPITGGPPNLGIPPLTGNPPGSASGGGNYQIPANNVLNLAQLIPLLKMMGGGGSSGGGVNIAPPSGFQYGWYR
jgi:hypothetical protein